jgi:hypothetical protein
MLENNPEYFHAKNAAGWVISSNPHSPFRHLHPRPRAKDQTDRRRDGALFLQRYEGGQFIAMPRRK